MESKKEAYELLTEEIKAKGYSAIEDLIIRRESEHFFVDFKRTQMVDYNGQRKLQDSDRANLAKAISGFGNSEGGILVWGVEAAAGTDGNDYAKSIKAIKNPENFCSLIESYVKLSTLPQHRSVHSFVIKKQEGDEDGLVITTIPRSNDRPLQNIAQNDFRYYIRTGDSFVPVSDTVLRGLFGPGQSSDLFMMFNVGYPKKLDDGGISVEIGLSVSNGGLGIATDIFGYARVWPPKGPSSSSIQIADTQNYSFQKAYGVEMSFMAKADHRIGYQQQNQILILQLSLVPPFESEMVVELLVGARNQAVHEKKINKSPVDLNQILEKHTLNLNHNIFADLWDVPSIKAD